MELLTDRLMTARQLLATKVTSNYFLGYVLWILFSVGMSSLAAFCVHIVGPYSAGSGIPAVRSILSGLLLPHYLSFRTMIAKIIGIICVTSGGLFVGKEGPYVHIMTSLASQLARVPGFGKIQRNEGLKLQLIAAGCAAGVAITFGAPIGGVIFSIEVTTTYYLIQNLNKAFFCAVIATLALRLMDTQGLIAFFNTDFRPSPYDSRELLAFTSVGVACGLLGALFNLYVTKLAQLRRNYKILNSSRYGQVIFIAVLTGLTTFPLVPLRSSPRDVLNELFSNAPLSKQTWGAPNVYFTLVAIIIAAFVLCGLSVGLPIPSGVYAPMFILGAAIGRLLGEVLKTMHILPNMVPAGYAVVGAAAWGAGTTRTLSSAIICFELTRQLEHVLPVLLAVLVASAVGNYFGPSIYEVLMKMKGLPYMPPFKSSHSGNKTAKAIMRRDVLYLTTESTYEELQSLLIQSHYSAFPLVQSRRQCNLLGVLPRKVLEKMLDKLESRLLALAERQVEILNLALLDQQQGSPSPTADSSDTMGHSLEDGTAATNSTPTIEANFKSRFGGLSASLQFDDDAQSTPESQKIQMLMQELTRQAMSEKVGFSASTPGLDVGAFQLPVQTPHSKVHFLFAMLGLNAAYIVDKGELVGVITKRDLINLQ